MCKDATNNAYLRYINNIESKITKKVEEFWRYIKSENWDGKSTPM